MARKLRVQYEGAIHHVRSRGDHREDIFRGAKDRELFLKTVGESCGKAVGKHGIPKGSAVGPADFEKRLEARRTAEVGPEFKPLARG